MSELVRVATWNSMGVNVSECKTIDDVLKQAGIDYTVQQCPMYTGLNNNMLKKTKIDGLVANVNSQTGDVLGIVSDSYNVCQNRDAFDFVNYIDDEIVFEKAGQTSGGIVYIIARLNEVNILGDTFVPHVIFQNGHNGGIPIRDMIVPLRIICQNQFSTSFNKYDNSINIRHTNIMSSRIEDAKHVLRATNEYMKSMTTTLEKYAATKIPEFSLDELVNKFFPMNPEMTNRQVLKITEARSRFITAYNHEDNRNFRDTAYGLVNAYSDFITHSEPTRKTENWEEGRFIRNSIGTPMDKIIEYVEDQYSVA